MQTSIFHIIFAEMENVFCMVNILYGYDTWFIVQGKLRSWGKNTCQCNVWFKEKVDPDTA